MKPSVFPVCGWGSVMQIERLLANNNWCDDNHGETGQNEACPVNR